MHFLISLDQEQTLFSLTNLILHVIARSTAYFILSLFAHQYLLPYPNFLTKKLIFD